MHIILPKIITYHPRQIHQELTIFIQSRGLHSGRPLKKPIANCFALTLSSLDEFQRYFTLIDWLYQTKQFSPYIIGTAVPFIRLKNLRSVIEQGIAAYSKNPTQFDKTASILEQVNALIEKRESELQQLQALKLALAQQAIRIT